MASSGPLGLQDIVHMIEKAARSDNPSTCVELISSNLLEAWFGIPPQRLALLLKSSIARGGDPHGSGRLILDFIGGALTSQAVAANSRSGLPRPLQGLGALGNGIYLRQKGRVREAHESMGRLQELFPLPVLYAETADISQLVAVQSGISAMLAGKLNSALDSFTRAKFQPISHSLGFLSRDANAKAALIQALFGEVGSAERMLKEARDVPRSISWVEAGIDTTIALTEATLALDSPRTATSILDSLTPQSIGEMWPYFIIVTHRVNERLGDRQDLRTYLAKLELYGWPQVPGDGLNGSVFQMIHAALALRDGDLYAARAHLSTTDSGILPVQLTRMVFELARGNSEQVLVVGRKASEEAGPLRLANLVRVLLEAAAYHSQGDYQRARSLLVQLAEGDGALTPSETRLVPSQIRDFARSCVPDWPRCSSERSTLSETVCLPPVQLTAREVEALSLVGDGLSRQEAAEAMWISLATLKTHLNSSFRKLKAENKDQALSEARRRGIF